MNNCNKLSLISLVSMTDIKYVNLLNNIFQKLHIKILNFLENVIYKEPQYEYNSDELFYNEISCKK